METIPVQESRPRRLPSCNGQRFSFALLVQMVAVLFVFLRPSALYADNLSIDVSTTVKTLKRPLVGENTTWLLSSDIHFSPPRNVRMKDRMATMGGGIARFPYGALAQNYRWHTPTWNSPAGKYDYSDAVNGLRPRVVSLTGPGNWTWAVNPDGTFPEAADFDEFIEQCHYAGMEPLVVVNVLAHKQFATNDPVISQLGMPGPLTENQMIEEAAAWVHYANVVRGYGVKYWAIGNEIEGPETTNLLSQAGYIRIFKKICYRMKQMDPTILTTPGTFLNTGWLDDLFNDTTVVSGYGTKVSKDYMDFIVTHQYLFGATWAETLAAWRAVTTTDPIPKVTGVNSWINSKTWPSGTKPELFVTEVGLTGADIPEDVETTQMGLKFAAKTTQRYLTLAANGDALVTKGDPSTDSEVMDMVAVPGKLGYTTIRAMAGTSSQFLRATGTGAVVRFDGDGTTTSCNWRRWRGKDACFFESEAFPGYYLKVNLTNNTLMLNTAVLDDSAQAIALEGRRFTTAQNQNGYYLWNAPVERLLESYPYGRILSFNIGSNQIEAKKVRGEVSSEFKFLMQDAGFISATSRNVRIRVVGAPGTTNYLRATGTAPAVTVDASGTGADNASTWIYEYTNTNAVGNTIGSQFRLQSKAYPGQYLLFEGTQPNEGLITAKGGATGDNGIFRMPALPTTWTTSYPAPPATNNEQDFLGNDHYKSLIWADMLLASLKLNRVGSMVHWNTLSAWSGKFGDWGKVSDSLEPTPNLGFAPVGKVQRLINLLATGRVLNVASAPSNALRTYACLDDDTGRLIIFALNKQSFTKALNLTLTGFSPSSTYEVYTYVSATNDPEDIAPVTTHLTGLATPGGPNFTIPALCLQVIILTDPAKANWPVSLLEYALNPSSTQPTVQQLATSVAAGGGLQLGFFRARPQLTYEVLASTNLINWTVIATNPGVVGETVTLLDTVPYSTGSARFFRLRVITPPDF